MIGFSMRCVVGVSWVMGAQTSLGQVATEPRVQEKFMTEPTTVLAMMRLESDVMNQRLSQRQRVTKRTEPTASLVSIYGLEPSLQATVRVGQREIMFVQGRRQPLTPMSGAIHLNYIKPPCVSFTSAGKSQIVCLKRVGS